MNDTWRIQEVGPRRVVLAPGVHGGGSRKEPELLTPAPLPEGPGSVYSNGAGTLHVLDKAGRVIAYVSYADGSRFNADELPPDEALGVALALARSLGAGEANLPENFTR